MEYIKFYCPLKFELHHNEDDSVTYDDWIPRDQQTYYRDTINADIAGWADRIGVTGKPDGALADKIRSLTPSVAIEGDNIYGTMTAGAVCELTAEEHAKLQEFVNGAAAEWSNDFAEQKIQTDGGDLFVHFEHSGYENFMMSESLFRNQKYVSENRAAFNDVRFFINGDDLTQVYYNPDASAGGQLVTNHYSSADFLDALESYGGSPDFWTDIEQDATQYLTDIDTSEFVDAAKKFAESPCAFSGETPETLEALREWAESMEQDQSMGMEMS